MFLKTDEKVTVYAKNEKFQMTRKLQFCWDSNPLPDVNLNAVMPQMHTTKESILSNKSILNNYSVKFADSKPAIST